MTYDTEFYAEETRIGTESSWVVIPWVLDNYPVKSVIDIGCGTGSWAACAYLHGTSAVGVDLQVPRHLVVCTEYVDCDLINGYPCSGHDLAICLEVAEHLPPSSAPLLVEGLVQAPTVLFSAATPGQPGVGHINCQEHDYWHDLFAAHGYVPTFIGGLFDEPVADFYRRNMYIYRRPA